MKAKLCFLVLLFLSLGIAGCDNDESKNEILPKYQAKGYVLGITGPCEGNALYIEVTTPQGIGKKGTFQHAGHRDEPIWKYRNAIGVPHFFKVDLPIDLMKKGTFLHFEYREYNHKKDSHYFDYDGVCTADKIPPTANYYIITKIISSKTKN